MDDSVPAYPAIPMDLFGSKKHRGERGFSDSRGNIVFRAKRQSSRPSSESESEAHRLKKTMLFDASGTPLFSIHRDSDRSWKVFKLDDGQEKRLILTTQKTRHILMNTEFSVFLSDRSSSDDSSPSFKMKGFPFQRWCTIYGGDSLVAQTSLMHKLKQIYVSRSKFRVTIYPCSVDHAIIVAMVVIFLDG